MTTENLTWDQAVLRVLEEARIPLHYTDVGSRVAQQQPDEVRWRQPCRWSHDDFAHTG